MSESQLTPLRKLRTALGLNGKDVADACGLQQSTYSKIENAPDGYRASTEAARAIVDYFGGALSLDQVLFPSEWPGYLKKFSPESNRVVSEIPLHHVSGKGR
jgi:transcriptional regulator with XRE-family HTH domain